MCTWYNQKFADKVRVVIKAGNGGNGCVSFHRIQHSSKYPVGGNGGKGGDVYFKGCKSMNNLYQIGKAHLVATPGKNGMSDKKDGRKGGDALYHVPLGTMIYELEEPTKLLNENKLVHFGLKTEVRNKKLIAEVIDDKADILIAKGGFGGRGNYRNRLVLSTEVGESGEKKVCELVLKIIADIGLIGYPNAGKTTLLAALTRAFPKIASYPFTTMRPYIGILKYADGINLSVCDTPGIIEDSHKGKGLGLEFLKHIERTKSLVYVIDGNGLGDHTPLHMLEMLRKELQEYDKAILDKPSIIAVNKCDNSDGFNKKIETLKRNYPNEQIFAISAKDGTNLDKLVAQFRKLKLT